MIYLIQGEDQSQVRAVGESLLAAQLKKYPDLTIFKFSVEDYSSEKFEEICLGQTLFDEKFIVVCHGFLGNAEPILIDRLPRLHRSPNLYILLEGELEEKILKQITDLGGQVKEIKKLANRGNTKPPLNFNPFAIADALGERDRKRAWLLFEEALARGLEPEDIFWKLVWKVKTMLLVTTAPDPTALGLKPFVLQQANRHCRNFSPAELKKISGQLVALWHERFRGFTDLELGLERLILEL